MRINKTPELRQAFSQASCSPPATSKHLDTMIRNATHLLLLSCLYAQRDAPTLSIHAFYLIFPEFGNETGLIPRILDYVLILLCYNILIHPDRDMMGHRQTVVLWPHTSTTAQRNAPQSNQAIFSAFPEILARNGLIPGILASVLFFPCYNILIHPDRDATRRYVKNLGPLSSRIGRIQAFCLVGLDQISYGMC